MADHHHHHREQQRRKPSWGCTLMAQASLCISLYAAFNIGRPQIPSSNGNNSSDGNSYIDRPGSSNGLTRALDLYFISVGGGSRPLEQQMQLLRQMEVVARMHKVKFVVDLSELGEGDPLMGNASLNFPFLKVPWYTTRTSREQGVGYFLKQIPIPHEQTLDIIGLDTGLWQDYFPTKELSDAVSNQLCWLTKTLAETDRNWRIVVGFHSIATCEEDYTTETINFYERLHRIFLKYRVNAYLSNQGCGGHYTRDGGFASIGNPGHADDIHRAVSVNGNTNISREMHDGFLLHRVSPLEIESYFINSSGVVVSKSTIHLWGREFM